MLSCKRVKVTQNSIHYIDKSVPGKSESSATNTNETTTQQPVCAYYIIPLFSGRCFHDSILHNAIGTHPARCHQSPITERPLYSQSRFFNSLILFRRSRHITITSLLCPERVQSPFLIQLKNSEYGLLFLLNLCIKWIRMSVRPSVTGRDILPQIYNEFLV